MTDNFTQAFEALQAQRQGKQPGWLDHIRREGLMQFVKQGFPSTREEGWKYTSLRHLTDLNFKPASVPEVLPEVAAYTEPEDVTVLLVNGRFQGFLGGSQVNSDQGVEIFSIRSLIDLGSDRLKSSLDNGAALHDRFLALNQAFLDDGVLIQVKRRQRVERPLHVLHVNTAEASSEAIFSRLIVHLEEGAELDLRESFISTTSHAAYFVNAVSQIRVEAGARLRHHRLQDHARQVTHIDCLHGSVGRDGCYDGLQVDLGSKLARHELELSTQARGAELRIDGLTLAGDGQHIDHQTVIDHKVGQTQSSQLYKSVVGSKGRSVFSGQILIKPKAQETQAFQLNKNLLLAKDAEADTRPQMIIDADDVKCSHGATIGQLSDDELFYLRSRGISASEARHLLVEAFLRDVLIRHKAAPGVVAIEQLIRKRVTNLYAES